MAKCFEAFWRTVWRQEILLESYTFAIKGRLSVPPIRKRVFLDHGLALELRYWLHRQRQCCYAAFLNSQGLSAVAFIKTVAGYLF
eukprot:1726347-Amphidinium_carterae.1